MRVKVSPDIPGAGSWEDEVVEQNADFFRFTNGMQLPREWCEKIPEVVPEPGDICEFSGPTVPKKHKPIKAGILKNIIALTSGGFYYLPEGGGHYETCRVLARKPKGFRDSGVADALVRFVEDFNNADTAYAEEAAYERFLSAILGVPYARVE